MSLVEELREVLLKKILEEKKVNSSNLEIIIHALRIGSALEARIWKVFHKDLVKDPETLKFILDIIPSEYAEKIEITNEAIDVLKESPMFTALSGPPRVQGSLNLIARSGEIHPPDLIRRCKTFSSCKNSQNC